MVVGNSRMRDITAGFLRTNTPLGCFEWFRAAQPQSRPGPKHPMKHMWRAFVELCSMAKCVAAVVVVRNTPFRLTGYGIKCSPPANIQ